MFIRIKEALVAIATTSLATFFNFLKGNYMFKNEVLNEKHQSELEKKPPLGPRVMARQLAYKLPVEKESVMGWSSGRPYHQD